MLKIRRLIAIVQPFNGLFSKTTWVSRYQKGKTNLDFTGARDSEWQWHQLSHMQVCTSLQADNHARTPSLSFLQAGCPSCRPTNSVKALKAVLVRHTKQLNHSNSLDVHYQCYFFRLNEQKRGLSVSHMLPLLPQQTHDKQ